jgi:hypothetical protein
MPLSAPPSQARDATATVWPCWGLVVSDPPTQSELQAIVSKLDELINALRR